MIDLPAIVKYLLTSGLATKVSEISQDNLEILTPLKSLVKAVAIASFKCFGFGGSTAVLPSELHSTTDFPSNVASLLRVLAVQFYAVLRCIVSHYLKPL